MPVYLELRCKHPGKIIHQEINPLREEFRRKPIETIEEWIADRGNELTGTELELISYRGNP